MLVRHTGKIRLAVERTDFHPGSPDNPYPELFEQLSNAVALHVPAEVSGFFTADFSTTGPVERAVSQIVMLEAFQKYFDFVMECICGIPEITLEGTPRDWRRIRERIELIGKLGMKWWRDRLRPICDEFGSI